MQFSFQGYPVRLNVLTIDTLPWGPYSSANPEITIIGNASISALHDSVFVTLIVVDAEPWAYVTRFNGLYADTANYKYVDMFLVSSINGIDYDGAGSGTPDFNLMITSNAADTLKATFYGTLYGFGGNGDTASLASIANGVFQLNY